MNCGVLHGDGIGAPEDRHGCVLPVNHGGQPHEYVAPNGEVIQWETDLECDCDHCMEAADNGDGDYCTIYWTKDRTPAQGSDAQHAAIVASQKRKE